MQYMILRETRFNPHKVGLNQAPETKSSGLHGGTFGGHFWSAIMLSAIVDGIHYKNSQK